MMSLQVSAAIFTTFIFQKSRSLLHYIVTEDLERPAKTIFLKAKLKSDFD